MKKSKFKTTIDLSFAGVSFACILAIYSKTPLSNNAIEAAKVFSIFIPLLIGASTAESLAISFRSLHKKNWLRYILLVLQLIGGIGLLGCYRGIYLFFKDISIEIGSVFLHSSLVIFLVLMFCNLTK